MHDELGADEVIGDGVGANSDLHCRLLDKETTMIIALLFLIILCLLFPGLLRIAAVLLLFGFLYFVAETAHAEPPRSLSECEIYDTSPQRAACRVRIMQDCPKSPLKAWQKCWDKHIGHIKPTSDAHSKVCFELGDSSSKSYQAAKCQIEKHPKFVLSTDQPTYQCVFDNGDQTTECNKNKDDGCYVCAGMD